MRGFYYQILRSIHSWLELAEGEYLYLEGAEDFDQVSSSGAEANQVKYTETSRTLTLRTPAAISAINNYWTLRTQNPGRAVRLNFLTTAKPGIEDGEPFGAGRGGVELWMKAAATVAEVASPDVANLQAFLLQASSLNAALLSELQSASTSRVHADLISHVAWHTAQPGIGDVEAALLLRLQSICWKRSTPTQWAEKIRDRLEHVAWSTAIKRSDRVLTIEDFYRHFDDVTTVSVPASTIVASLTPIAAAKHLGFAELGLGAPPLAIAAASSRLGVAPPLIGTRIARPDIKQLAIDALHNHGVTHLHAATGMGKTTEVAALAQELNVPVLWADCRDIAADELRVVMEEVGRRITLDSIQRYVVLDDVDTLAHGALLEGTAPAVLYILRGRGGGLVLTGTRPLPQRLMHRLNVPAAINVFVPSLTVPETRSLLKVCGAPEDQWLDFWARLIHAKASGHPQLVTAHIANLAQRDFAAPTGDDLLATPIEVKSIREEARLVLCTEIPQPQKEILYRLSLLTGSFERRRALALACISPPIAAPGDALDPLVGPWIEKPQKANSGCPLYFTTRARTRTGRSGRKRCTPP